MIYILLYEVNDYDQYGRYFMYAWDHKPTEEELDNLIPYKETEKDFHNAIIKNLINNGGGRLKKEDIWYYLIEFNQTQNVPYGE